ncbi:hypothetical protein [Ligilactobacillus cholophilus]|uniref:hypothetical protein n=1 Tax=Ligilactobacillus cholophilus TaxID=3050131 RepID=UPI0025B26EEF|nr:hypothetical protein [Ligilactobacillus cholophilus]
MKKKNLDAPYRTWANVPLNEDKETLQKIEEEYNEFVNREHFKKVVKKILIGSLILVGIFCFVINLGNPTFLAIFAASLFLDSFSNKN